MSYQNSSAPNVGISMAYRNSLALNVGIKPLHLVSNFKYPFELPAYWNYNFLFSFKFGNSLGHFLEKGSFRNVASVTIFWNHLGRSLLFAIFLVLAAEVAIWKFTTIWVETAWRMPPRGLKPTSYYFKTKLHIDVSQWFT